jgi:hypothetical protein
MSFLESTGDAETLAEALAFVDTFDFCAAKGSRPDDASLSSSGNSDGAAVEPHKRRRRDSHDREPDDKRDKAKGRRRNAVYSARLRAKKKSEMQQLKEQATQLQMQLERVKSAKPFTAACSARQAYKGHRTPALWLQEATAQAYQRQQAEKLNAQLRILVARVIKRSRSMQDAFQSLQSLGCEINVAVGAPSTILAGPSLRSNDATPQLGELRAHLDHMYASANQVFATSDAGPSDSASFASQIKRDPLSGRRVVHLSSSTPITSDLDTASRLVWRGMQLMGSKCCKYFVHRLHVNANSIAKSFFLNGNEDATPCTLHGAAFVRKVEERDRILYIWTTTMVPATQDANLEANSWTLRIREYGWAMLSRSPSNPDGESVFRTCYEVSSELREQSRDVRSSDFDRLSNGVVNLLSSDLRKFHERVQEKLLAA